MKAIIYGYNAKTEEWEELLNKGNFWIKMNGTSFMLRRTIKLSKKHNMMTYLLLKDSETETALLPHKAGFEFKGIFLTYSVDYEQASNWRIRKTIPTLKLKDERTYWTNKYQFLPSMILGLNLMDIYIEYWDSLDLDHVKTISDFIINALTEMSGEEIKKEAELIMSNEDTFQTFYKEVESLGVKKETFEVAFKKYSKFLNK